MGMTIHVVAIFSVGLGGISEYVARFEARHPHARVAMEYIHPEHVYERVREGTAEFGIVSFPRHARDLTILAWRDEEMVIACSPAHPFARFRSVMVEQLDGEKFVAFEQRLTIRREIDRYFRDHGVNVDVEVEVDSAEHVKKWIEQKVGLSLLPEPVVRQEARDGLLHVVRLEGSRMMRPLGIIHRKRHPPSPVVQDFIGLLRGNDAARSTPQTNGHSDSGPRGKRTVP
jgi:DNA-binding transcriptional LysR family regulator